MASKLHIYLFFAIVALAVVVTAHRGRGRDRERDEDIYPPFGQGYALQFNSASKTFVKLSTKLHFGGTFGIEFLLRWRDTTDGTILYLSNNDCTKERIIVRIASQGSNTARIELDICDKRGYCSTSVQSSRFIDENEWTYVAIVGRAHHTYTDVDFWVQSSQEEGTQHAGSSWNPRVSTSTRKPVGYIGKNPITENAYNGDLDEVRLWSHHNIFTTRWSWCSPKTNHLAAYYTFNEGSGSVAKDDTRHGYHGSLGDGVSSRAPIYIGAGFGRERTCTVWGNRVWIQTFDQKVWKESKYNVYDLAKGDVPSQAELLDLQIRLDRNARSILGLGSSITGVAFKYKGDLVVIDLDFGSSSDNDLAINNSTVLEDDVSLSSGLSITKRYKNSKQIYTVQAGSDWKLEVEAQAKKAGVSIKLKLSEHAWKSRNINGICGNFDGSSSNDATNGQESSSSYFPYLPSPGDSGGFDCTIPSGSPLESQATSTCTEKVPIAYQEACLFDVCSTLDIGAATISAKTAYDSCLEDNGASSTPGNPCVKPCPSFCSFQGTCLSDGTCDCFTGFGGSDCSQQASYRCYTAEWATGSTTLTPLVSSQTLEQHYSYDSPTRDSANTGNEIADSAVFYFYQRTTDSNTGSLVWINDKAKDGSGGKLKATFRATNNLSQTFPINLNVKDDTHRDSYSTSTGQIVANWDWDSSSTDGLALSGNFQTGSFCIDITLANIKGLDNLYASSENLFGEQDLQVIRISDAAGLKVCGTTCTNPCGSYYSCGSCLADSQCGWCADSGTCEQGNAGGPSGGRCSAWRYNSTVSRVVFASPSYPIDPAEIEVDMKSNNLQAQFFVNFPSTANIPLEVVILQEVTASSFLELNILKLLLPFLRDEILDQYPTARIGLTSFSDKPKSPYGQVAKDYVYKIHHRLTDNLADLEESGRSGLRTLNGRDSKQAQLEALLQIATSSEIGWSASARRVVLIFTKSSYHTPVSGLPANNVDGIVDANENYPSEDQVYTALLQHNIVPIFISKGNLDKTTYGPLVGRWGFGHSFPLCSSLLELTKLVMESLSVVGGTANAIIKTPGKVSAVSSGYTGISPLSRVKFTATVDASSTTTEPAVIVVPGFGSVTVSYSGFDAPEPIPCGISYVDCTATRIVQLAGNSPVNDDLHAKITQVPLSGSLYQFGTTPPVKINAGDLVSDAALQVIYDPEGSCASNFSVTFKYALYDTCEICSTEDECSVRVNAIVEVPPPVAGPASPLVCVQNQPSDPYTLVGTGTGGSGDLEKRIARFPDAGTIYHADGATIVTEEDPVVEDAIIYYPPENQVGQPLTVFTFKVRDRQTNKESQEAEVPVIITAAPSEQNPTPSPGFSYCVEDQACLIELAAANTNGVSVSFAIETLPEFGVLGTCQNVTSCPVPNVDEQNFYLGANPLYFKSYPDVALNTSFHFSVCPEGSSSCSLNTAPQSIFVMAVNDKPVAESLFISVDQNSVDNTIALLATDVDDLPNSLTLLVNWNGAGTLTTSNGTIIPHGTTTVPNNSSLRFSPLSNTVGNVAFSYRAVDAELESDPATVSITINRVSYASVADAAQQNGDQFENRTIYLQGSNINNDSNIFLSLCDEPEFGGLLYQMDGTALGVGEEITDASFSGNLLTSRVIFYTDNTGSDVFKFQAVSRLNDPVESSPCVSVEINITSAQRPNALAPISTVLVQQEVPTPIPFAGNTSESVTLSYEIISIPDSSKGYLRQEDGNETISAHTIVGPSGTLVFEPAYNVHGETSFTWQVVDSNGIRSDVITVPVVIEFVNHAPEAFANTHSFMEDSFVDFDLAGTDRDNSTLTFYVNTGLALAGKGLLEICLNSECSSTAEATADSEVPTRRLRFTPSPHTYGSSYNSFTFRIEDGDLPTMISNIATITFDVTFINYPPALNIASQDVHINDISNVTLELGGTDVHHDRSELDVIILSTNLKGALYEMDGVTQIIADEPYSHPEQKVIYVPAKNMGDPEQVFDAINYVLRNPTSATSAQGTVNMYVTHVYNPPVAFDAPSFAPNEVTHQIFLGGFDPNGLNGSLVAIIFNSTDKAILKDLDLNPLQEGDTAFNRTVLYTPPGYLHGDPFDEFSFILYNSFTGLYSNVAHVTISVAQGSPHPPEIEDPVLSPVYEDIPYLITLNVHDVDGDEEPIVWWQGGNHGEYYWANEDGSLREINPLGGSFVIPVPVPAPHYIMYFPSANYSGNVQITFFAAKACCNFEYSANIVSYIFPVIPVPDAPLLLETATNVSIPNIGSALTMPDIYSIPVNVEDIDSRDFTFILLEPPTMGAFYVVNGMNAWLITENSWALSSAATPNNRYALPLYFFLHPDYYGQTGQDSFTFVLLDDHNLTTVNHTIYVDFYFAGNIPVPNPIHYNFTLNEDQGQYPFFLNGSDGLSPPSDLRFRMLTVSNADTSGNQGYNFYLQTIQVPFYINWAWGNPSFPSGYRWVVGTKMLNYNTGTTKPFVFCYRFTNWPTGAVYDAGVPTCGNYFHIAPVNDPPVVLCSTCSFSSIASPVTAYSFSDVDCTTGDEVCSDFNFRLSVDNTASATLSFVDTSGATCSSDESSEILCSGSPAALNAVLSSGFVINRLVSTAFTVKSKLQIWDNGNVGVVFVNATGSKEITFSVPDITPPGAQQEPGFSDEATAGALVGGTSVVSASVFGIYKLLKKRKLLPEDANPWETDDGFDNTLDNPLYTGMPTTSTAASVTLVTTDA